ncbi:MAG: RNA polymerase sigma factor [Marinirhabdus sp.]
MTLNELIAQCKAQDAKAQGVLFKKYSGALFTICLRYSPNYAEAEDNLQDAFITIFKKIGQYNGKGSFEGWIKRITVNTALQKYRKQKVYDLVHEDQIEDETSADAQTGNIPLQYLLKIVQQLPTKYRMVFSLYVLDGYSHKEIGAQLNISDGTSKSNLARARGILKKKIESYKKETDLPLNTYDIKQR